MDSFYSYLIKDLQEAFDTEKSSEKPQSDKDIAELLEEIYLPRLRNTLKTKKILEERVKVFQDSTRE